MIIPREGLRVKALEDKLKFITLYVENNHSIKETCNLYMELYKQCLLQLISETKYDPKINKLIIKTYDNDKIIDITILFDNKISWITFEAILNQENFEFPQAFNSLLEKEMNCIFYKNRVELKKNQNIKID